MATMKHRFFRNAAATLAVTAMAIAPISAKKADSLRDLVGASGASAETQLSQRGFEYISGDKTGSSSSAYWWHQGGKDCVVVEVKNGRVARINDTKSEDCGKKSGNDTAIAAAAIGAVAIGALLLSGKDKDKHREQYNQDWQEVQVYNTQSGNLRIFRKPDKGSRVRGEVREGTFLRNYGCDNRNGESWCEVSTMNGRTRGWARDRYLRVTGNYPGGGWGGSGGSWDGSGGGFGGSGGSGGDWGGSGSGQYGFLVGDRPARAEGVLRDRGLRTVDRYSSGRTDYSIWYSRRTGECVRMGVDNDRVQSVNDIRTHPRCR
ncbi:MAG: hypothetical protein ACK4IC_08860 [Erythrobacter sp.]